jgi:hypothetical protein
METTFLGNSMPRIQWCCLFSDMSKDFASYFQNEVYLCILPNSFVELIKRHTHLRAGPGDVVHPGTNLIIKFCVQIYPYVSFLLSFPSLWCTLIYAHLIQLFNKS